MGALANGEEICCAAYSLGQFLGPAETGQEDRNQLGDDGGHHQ